MESERHFFFRFLPSQLHICFFFLNVATLMSESFGHL